jgi:hypothetical protein
MLDYERIETIKFSGKYVKGIAKDVLLDFSNNSYLIKGSTGIGATTALLNYKEGNVLIISPNVGMIKGKEGGNYHSDKQLFIYSDSENNWKEVSIYLDEIALAKQNLIINTTPNQILKIKSMNPPLYEQLIKMPVFVDEIHAFALNISYREKLGEFMELVYNEWKAVFKLSTATPIFNHIDIPKDKNIQIYNLERENETPKPIRLSSSYRHAKEFVYNEHKKRRLVVVFTNNINLHKSFRDLRVANLVGKNLKLKLTPYGRGNVDVNLNYSDYDVIIISSSYFAGFDLKADCSICIVSEQQCDAYKINIPNFVQAYGRCRKNIHNSLYINVTAKKDKNYKPIVYPKTIDEVNHSINSFISKLSALQSEVENVSFRYELRNSYYITPSLYVNRLSLLNDTIIKVNDYHQYNNDVLRKILEEYNFIISDYEPTDEKSKIEKRITFKEKMSNLMMLSNDQLYKYYLDIKLGLKSKGDGAFTSNLALEYLTAYLLKQTNDSNILDKFNNKIVKVNEFYKCVDLFLRSNVNTDYYFEQLTQKQLEACNGRYKNDITTEILKELSWMTDDWQMLYAIYRVKNQELPEAVLRVIKLHEEAYNLELYQQFQDDKKHRVRDTMRAIISNLKTLKVTLDVSEKEWLKERIKSMYRDIDKGKRVYSITKESLKKEVINCIGFLLTSGSGNHKSKEIKNREYNGLTHLPKGLRCMIPLKYLSIDLDSANAQIVDDILGSNIGLSVYDNLISNLEITRNQAKTQYNKTLNRHYLSLEEAKSFYMDCGYSNVKALWLARKTTNVKKGEFYELLTAVEKRLINNYREILSVESFRFHDALIVSLESLEYNHFSLPTVVKGLKYHFNLFNDGSDYLGVMSNPEAINLKKLIYDVAS